MKNYNEKKTATYFLQKNRNSETCGTKRRNNYSMLYKNESYNFYNNVDTTPLIYNTFWKTIKNYNLLTWHRVTPVFKRDDPTKHQNYCQMSILPTVPKIFKILFLNFIESQGKYLMPNNTNNW